MLFSAPIMLSTDQILSLCMHFNQILSYGLQTWTSSWLLWRYQPCPHVVLKNGYKILTRNRNQSFSKTLLFFLPNYTSQLYHCAESSMHLPVTTCPWQCDWMQTVKASSVKLPHLHGQMYAPLKFSNSHWNKQHCRPQDNYKHLILERSESVKGDFDNTSLETYHP